MKKHVVSSDYDVASGTIITYITGFILSLILTLLAYFLVTQKLYTSVNQIIVIIAGLAVIQLFVQLIFFLHLGRESKPRWNVTVFVFAVLVVLIIIFGSIWIMNNLDYNMNHSDSKIIKDELNHE
ncbi:MAG: cytochrome o ubiquinol oxidase subunit IV [Bacteroidetes bacterium]|nr:cytochrome o ubiquinol oxidase subunit IV [Bacteroidota bacterium]